eukprot:16451931-Heterocapsa_arctica.AAC.1
MAAAQLAAAVAAAAVLAASEIRTLSSDLKFLLEDRGVSAETLLKFEEKGVLTLSSFALIVDGRADLRELLKSDFALDPAQGFAQRVQQAAVVEAWEAAVQRSARAREEEALQRSARLPRTLTRTDHVAMRRAFESAFFKIEDR